MPIDKGPVDLEAEAGAVAEMQVTVAQFRGLAEEAISQLVSLRPAAGLETLRNLLGSATIAGVSSILARAQLAVFHQARTADLVATTAEGDCSAGMPR